MESRLSKLDGSGDLGSRLVKVVKEKALVSHPAAVADSRASFEVTRASGDGVKS